ncbi:MAG: hypothetical protein Q8N03_16280 [Ignavibacteria bacterium]|nr:hypothetical protein [Ignavibacteria bacterium]
MKQFQTYYHRNLPHYQPPGYTFFVTYRLNGSLPIETIKRLKEEREQQLKVIAGYTNKTKRLEEYKKYQSAYFGKFDKLLDGSDYGPIWLKENSVAQIVKDAMHFYDEKSYDLICYTIMYNHVHQVFTPIVNGISDTTDTTDDSLLNSRNGVSNYKSVGRISDSRTDKSVVLISDSTTDKPEENNQQVNNNKNLVVSSENEEQYSRNGVSDYIVTKILQDLKKFTAVKCNKLLNRSGAFWQHESYDHVVRDEKELRRIVMYVLNNPVKAGLCEKWEDWKYSYCNFKYLSM